MNGFRVSKRSNKCCVAIYLRTGPVNQLSAGFHFHPPGVEMRYKSAQTAFFRVKRCTPFSSGISMRKTPVFFSAFRCTSCNRPFCRVALTSMARSARKLLKDTPSISAPPENPYHATLTLQQHLLHPRRKSKIAFQRERVACVLRIALARLVAIEVKRIRRHEGFGENAQRVAGACAVVRAGAQAGEPRKRIARPARRTDRIEPLQRTADRAASPAVSRPASRAGVWP